MKTAAKRFKKTNQMRESTPPVQEIAIGEKGESTRQEAEKVKYEVKNRITCMSCQLLLIEGSCTCGSVHYLN